MTPVIALDASALLTYVFGEPGSQEVEKHLPGAVMHTVNFAEVLSKLAERGLNPEDALSQLEAAGVLPVLTIDPGVPEDAVTVARLRQLTRSHGLSLGDRYCLALAQRLGCPAATTDRAWAALTLGITIKLLR